MLYILLFFECSRKMMIFKFLFVFAIVIFALGRVSVASADLPILDGTTSICIHVFELPDYWMVTQTVDERDDLAEMVSGAIQPLVSRTRHSMKFGANGNCKPFGASGRMDLNLSIKRQKIQQEGRVWNLVVAGGATVDGFLSDRNTQPVIIIKTEDISDDEIIESLVEFVNYTIIVKLRPY